MTTSTHLTVENDRAVLRREQDEDPGAHASLPWSWSGLAERFFHADIPTAAEVEYAINAVEDALEALPAFDALEARSLVSQDATVRAVLNPAGAPPRMRSRQEVEELFTRYARMSMGRSPAADDLVVDKEEYAALLVVREVLHHLDYPGIVS